MNEELQVQLIPILENTKEGIAKAVDFLCEQSPILVREILQWEFCKSAFLFGVFAVLFIIGVYYSNKMRKWVIKTDCRDTSYCQNNSQHVLDNCCLCPGVCFTLYVLIYIVCPIILYNCLNWIQILVAPRYFLIKYVADFCK